MDCHSGLLGQVVGALVASSWVARQGAPWRTGAMVAVCFYLVGSLALAPRGRVDYAENQEDHNARWGCILSEPRGSRFKRTLRVH